MYSLLTPLLLYNPFCRVTQTPSENFYSYNKGLLQFIIVIQKLVLSILYTYIFNNTEKIWVFYSSSLKLFKVSYIRFWRVTRILQGWQLERNCISKIGYWKSLFNRPLLNSRFFYCSPTSHELQKKNREP